jgi:MFS family permease
LGGNIPIDATITLEFLPQDRRNLVSLLSMWQPIGVVVASAIAYGTAAKWRCDPTLPSCHAVAKGKACCTVASNMGWRYNVIVLGCLTLTVFFLRYFVFHFYESPKFLLSRGKEAEAIEVLQKIAKFNKAVPPSITLDDFRAIDDDASQTNGSKTTTDMNRDVIKKFFASFKHLKGLFLNKLQCFIFILLAIAYMVSASPYQDFIF